IVDGGSARFRCRLRAKDEQQLVLDLEREYSTDARSSERLSTSLAVRYHLVSLGESHLIIQWLAEGRVIEGLWHRSDPGVDLSMSGMRFVGSSSCKIDDVLLAEMVLPGGEVGWRCSSLVRRVRALREDRQEIAVELVDILDKDEDEMVAFVLNLD
ncbi:MAG: hypothetical protein HN348_36235, partial [Proteobacteria bacterium]|nr:hypothetical protein [Pseudomonadota bacterium]